MKHVKLSINSEHWKKWLNKVSWRSPKVIGGSLVVVLLLGGSYIFSTNSAAYVVINGEPVGIVENVQSGKDLIEKVLDEKGASLGVSAKTHDEIEYTRARMAKGEVDVLTEEELEQKLSYYIEGVEVTVADNSLFVLPDQENVDNLLKAYQELYVKSDESNQVTSVTFEEEVGTQSIEATPESVTSFDQALEKLKQGNIQKNEYEIQESDSWWLIARKNDLLTSEVLAANPGATLDTVIKPGEKIFIEKVSPYLTVVSEGTQTDKETIPFDVVTKTDATLASGQSKVTQAGADGEKEVKYTYVKKNDKIISKSILDETVLKKSVEQVVAKGPQRTQVTVASSRGSGQTGSGLIRPYGGTTSSYYGYRGGEFHTGIDYSGSVGDPYVAAASGKVVSAGWNGNYGYSLVIDHGNGIQTRYAHSSKLLVKAGQSVSKGQTIGLVGSTGRSTGPHLHFEVIINGDTVNPLNYLR
jgi:murein DD-endopeptidase MepM/ murein hydrolase activator NlpD